MQQLVKTYNPIVTGSTVDVFSPSQPVKDFMMYSYQVTVSGGAAAGDLMPQGSNDGTSWVDLLGAAVAYTVGATKLIRVTDVEFAHTRLKIDPSADGTANIVFVGKGP